MYNQLTEVIKMAALQAVQAAKPMDFAFGKVTSTSPLSIRVEQKLELGKEFFVLTDSVSDWNTTMIIDGETKSVTVQNGLKSGERVLLLALPGGQKYIVLNRVVS